MNQIKRKLSLTFSSVIFLIFLSISFVLLYSCTSFKSNPLQGGNKNISVIFVPGYKGSLLKDNDSNNNKIVWLSASHALGFSSPDLKLGANDQVTEAGILESVDIPFLYKKDIYSPWMDTLRKQESFDSYFFSYDWRKDNSESSLKLTNFIKEIKSKNNLPIVLVGHSNGGLLAMSSLNKNPELVSKVVFVGTPFSGGVGFLEDLMIGVNTGINSKIVSPCVVQTFESIYSFFPRENTFDTKELLFDENKNVVQNRFYDANFWKTHNLGTYSVGSPCDNEPISALQQRLNKALKFKESLDTKKEIKYPPVLVVRAENKGTIRRVFGRKMNEGWRWKILEGERVPGDGRVTNENALPPPGIPFSLYVSTADHSELLNDKETSNSIVEFIKK
jgi:pimeloyl-ACP methyl ester carboxylesterase